MSFIVKHNANLRTGTCCNIRRIRRASKQRGLHNRYRSVSFDGVQILGSRIKPIYSPDPVRSAIMRGPSDGEFSLA